MYKKNKNVSGNKESMYTTGIYQVYRIKVAEMKRKFKPKHWFEDKFSEKFLCFRNNAFRKIFSVCVECVQCIHLRLCFIPEKTEVFRNKLYK